MNRSMVDVRAVVEEEVVVVYLDGEVVSGEMRRRCW